jgi:thioredoxin 1
MKNLVFLFVFAVLLLQNCNSGQANNKGDEKSGSKPSEEKTVTQTVSDDGGTVNLTKEIFLERVWDYQKSPQKWVYKGDKPALIDFYADWCGPCKIASPILNELSKEYGGKIIVYKIDTEVEQELAAIFRVRSIPAFLYIPVGGKPVMMSGIARSKEETKNMFRDNIDKYLLTAN